jgi:hypothetical protein
MGSFLCLTARGAFVTSTSLLCFHLSFHNKCTGNGGPGANKYCAKRADLVSVSLALSVMPWVGVLSLHATAPINSSLALGDNGFGPKWLAKRSTALILGMAATTWSTALACNVGGRKNLAKRQGTYRWALPRACARFPDEFPFRKNPPQNCVFLNKEGYPYLVRFGLLCL